jgi:hypothetical protein
MFAPTELSIILAIVGMVGLFSTAIIWQRANKITHNYYKNTMDHTPEDYSYYEYVEANEKDNLTIIEDAPKIREHDE